MAGVAELQETKMSGQHPPISCSDFKDILKALGFEHRKSKNLTSGSHENWVGKDANGKFRKVTVDCPKAPFSQDLISAMAHQAGVTKKKIYEIYFGQQKIEPSPSK
jgi:predicted RNA binding protein YcfA (HicA-like mRNA interferase family)